MKHLYPVCSILPLLFSVCIFERSNPIDPENGDPVPPVVEIAAPASINVTFDSISISWSGNNDFCEFRYELDGIPLSGWTGATTADLARLDEGRHAFVVNVRYPGRDLYDTDTVEFVVDALPAKSIYLYPRMQNAPGDSAKITVKVKKLSPAHLMHLKIAGVKITNATLESSPDPLKAHLFFNDSIVDIMTLPGGTAIEGSRGVVGLVVRRGKEDSTEVRIAECVVKDSTGTEVEVDSVRVAGWVWW